MQLIKSVNGMKDKARGTQESTHITKIASIPSTAQRRISPVQPFKQRFLQQER